MPTLYIVKTGSTFDHIAQSLGDFEQWIAEGLHPPELLPAERLRLAVIHAPSCRYATLHYPEATDCAGVVISGSHAMVTDHAPWMQDLQSWLRPVCDAGVPVLGICFGHQILAHLLGGEVGPHPAGLELGTIPVAVQADVSHDPLWRHMPGCFEAQAVHYQSVRQLPPEARVLAGNSHEAHHAFRWRHNVWGVQFHPEFSAAAMQAYIDHIPPTAWPRTGRGRPHCDDTPQAAQLLQHFARHVQQQAALRAHSLGH